VAAVVPSEATAAEFVDRLRSSGEADDVEIRIASPNNHGARIEKLPDVDPERSFS
jgi:hypothetical protein